MATAEDCALEALVSEHVAGRRVRLADGNTLHPDGGTTTLGCLDPGRRARADREAAACRAARAASR